MPPEDNFDTDVQIGQQSDNNQNEKGQSKLFKLLSNMFYAFLLASLALAIALTALTIDFLDIIRFRHHIPEALKQIRPFSSYIDFVKLHQLPEEEKYQEMMYRMQQRYDRKITQRSKELDRRAEELESSYRTLMRTHRERHGSEQQSLQEAREELENKQKELEEREAKLEEREKSVQQISRRLASEAIALESSLIKFMEDDNRLGQVQSIAASMDPEALGIIFDGVRDDRLLYDILSGIPPDHAARVLASMDAENAGRILRAGQQPLQLPEPGGPTRDYIPPGLQNLIEETQNNLD